MKEPHETTTPEQATPEQATPEQGSQGEPPTGSTANGSTASSAPGPATKANSLSNFLQKQVDQRADSANAFQAGTTAEPSMRDLLEEQVKLQRQVRGIKNHLVRVQQGVMICQILCVLVAGSLVALVSFVYFQPGDTAEVSRSSTEERSVQPTVQQGQTQRQWGVQAGHAEKHAIEPRHQQLIFDFLSRTHNLKPDLRETEEQRMLKLESYIKLLSDLSLAGEKLAQENAPRKVNQMLTNVARYAEKLQSNEKESLEMLRLRQQILIFCMKNQIESEGLPES